MNAGAAHESASRTTRWALRSPGPDRERDRARSRRIGARTVIDRAVRERGRGRGRRPKSPRHFHQPHTLTATRTRASPDRRPRCAACTDRRGNERPVRCTSDRVRSVRAHDNHIPCSSPRTSCSPRRSCMRRSPLHPTVRDRKRPRAARTSAACTSRPAAYRSRSSRCSTLARPRTWSNRTARARRSRSARHSPSHPSRPGCGLHSGAARSADASTRRLRW